MHWARGIRSDKRGSVTVAFGLMLVMILLAAGLAIDLSRALNARSHVVAALDAGALAGAKLLLDEGATDSDVAATAQAFFNTYLAGLGATGAQSSNFTTTTDRSTWTVTTSVNIKLNTMFGRLAGVSLFNMTPTAKVRYQADKVEVAFVVDVTGSMNDTPAGDTQSKMTSLKQAASDVIDTLMANSMSENMIRIAVAPFAASVNAGALSYSVSAAPPTTTCTNSWQWGWHCTTSTGSDVDTCVIERVNAEAATDAAPTGTNTIPAVPSLPYGRYSCPQAQVIPLLGKSQADQLKTTINGYTPGGSTAGHIGAAWGWYLLSPNWSSVLPSTSTPAAYSDKTVHKHVVFMTDGLFNTSYLNGPSTASSTQVDESYAQFDSLCTNMKAKGITVWTIGFDLHDGRAIQELKDCGGDNFFDVKTGSDLKAAFQAIVSNLQNLRVSG